MSKESRKSEKAESKKSPFKSEKPLGKLFFHGEAKKEKIKNEEKPKKKLERKGSPTEEKVQETPVKNV